MGQVKLHPCGHCLRFTLIFWNILVLMIGVAALAVGIWQVVENDDYSDLTGDGNTSAGVLSIVSGIIAILVALLGIIGAIALSRILIGLYAVIIVIFIVLELVSGILGFVFRDNLESTVTDNAEEAIRGYQNSTTDRRIIDRIQDEFECCGWNNYTDWEEYDIDFPSSCDCDNDDDDGDDDGSAGGCINVDGRLVYKDGCQDGVVSFLETYQLVLGAIGIVFGLIQIAVLVISIVLCLCIHKAREEYTTV